MLTTLGGRVECRQCNALSKRTKQQCKVPAIRGKTKCRFHGGASTGPKSKAGRDRIAAAQLKHGKYVNWREKRKREKFYLAQVKKVIRDAKAVGLLN